MNFEAKLTIVAPGLERALNRLADALAYPPQECGAHAGHAITPDAAPAPEPAPAAPVVPVAAAPSYTLEQIGKAGSDMLAANPARRDDLLKLLGQFGARSVNELKPEQLGAFATALRGLGAKL